MKGKKGKKHEETDEEEEEEHAKAKAMHSVCDALLRMSLEGFWGTLLN